MVILKAEYPFFMVLQQVNAATTFVFSNRKINKSTFSL